MDFETLVRAKNELEPRVQQLVAHLGPERKALELEQIEERTTAPGFWDDPNAAKPLLQKRGSITNDIALAMKAMSVRVVAPIPGAHHRSPSAAR